MANSSVCLLNKCDTAFSATVSLCWRLHTTCFWTITYITFYQPVILHSGCFFRSYISLNKCYPLTLPWSSRDILPESALHHPHSTRTLESLKQALNPATCVCMCMCTLERGVHEREGRHTCVCTVRMCIVKERERQTKYLTLIALLLSSNLLSPYQHIL